MNFLDLVKTRQSCRKYSDKPVPAEDVKCCLEAARLAPSACNSQPWKFIVVDEKEKLEKLSDAAFHDIYSMNSFAAQAPVMIAVVREKSTYAARLSGTFKGTEFALIDIGIACEHLMLAAAEKGLGTCYLGWFDEKQVKKVLAVPAGQKIDLIISMGFPDSSEIREKDRKNFEEIARTV